MFGTQWAKVLTSDGAGLAIVGFIAVARGLAHTPLGADPLRTPSHMLEMLMPAMWWGVVWALLGTLCVAAIGVRRLRPIAVGLTSATHFLWAISLFMDDHYPSKVMGLIYLSMALFMMWSFARGRQEPALFHKGDT